MAIHKKTIHSSEYHQIIKRLISCRKKADLTQSQVAKKLNSSQSYISKIENCQIRLDFIQLKIFSEIYHISLSEILEENNK